MIARHIPSPLKIDKLDSFNDIALLWNSHTAKEEVFAHTWAMLSMSKQHWQWMPRRVGEFEACRMTATLEENRLVVKNPKGSYIAPNIVTTKGEFFWHDMSNVWLSRRHLCHCSVRSPGLMIRNYSRSSSSSCVVCSTAIPWDLQTWTLPVVINNTTIFCSSLYILNSTPTEASKNDHGILSRVLGSASPASYSIPKYHEISFMFLKYDFQRSFCFDYNLWLNKWLPKFQQLEPNTFFLEHQNDERVFIVVTRTLDIFAEPSVQVSL